jgi:outer membrane protein assembly factor BamB
MRMAARPVAPLLILLTSSSLLVVAAARAQERPAVFTQEDRDVDEAFGKAAALERQGLHSKAGEEYAKLENLLEKKREKDPDARIVVRTSELVDRGAAEVLHARLKALPDEGVATYRTLVDARARANFDAALDAGDADALEAIAERYSYSKVAPLALQALGDTALERGDFARAERAYARLERNASSPEMARRAAFQRLSTAAARGDAAAAADALASFTAKGGDPNARRIPSNGRLLSAAEAVDEARRASRALAPKPVDPGRLVASLELDSPELPEELASRLERVSGVVPAYQEPVFDIETGLVLVADQKTVRALDPERTGRGWRFSVAGATDEPGRLEVATERPAVGGGHVFATFFRNRPAIRVKRANPPAPPGAAKKKDKPQADDEDEIRRQPDWRVVALDDRTGRFEWDAASDPRFEEFSREAEWVSAPLNAEGQVFVSVLARKGSDLRAYLVALDASTGKVRSRAFLASRSPYDFLGLGAPLPAPTFSAGRIYVASSIGVVACVEPARCEVEWLAHYASVPERSQPDVVKEERRFRARAPLAEGGSPVVVAPVDAEEILAFDAETGARVWSIPRGDARVLAEAPSGVVLVVSDRVVGFERKTGAARFLGERLPGRPVASPLVFPAEALVPLESALVRVSLEDGRLLARYRYEQPSLEAGALVAAGEGRIVTASWSRANVYEDRARTLDSTKNKDSGEAALVLGELAARRGEAETASRQLAEAASDVTLAHSDRMRARRLAFAVLAEQAARARDEGRRGAFLESARAALDHAEHALGSAAALDAASAELARRAATLRRQYADVLSEGVAPDELVRAVREYGKLLASAHGTLCALDSGTLVDARCYAQLKVRELVAAKGRACYEAEDKAAADLVKIAVGTGTKEGLEKVKALFPASRELATALWELHKFYLKGGLESEAALALLELADDEPESPLAPEALARLALLDERMHRTARARRVAERLARLPEDAAVRGADGAPERLARALAAEILARNGQADEDTLAREDAAADLEPRLRRVFRSTTELSASGAELVEPRNFALAPKDRFLVRRGRVLEARSRETGVAIASFDAPPSLVVERRWPGYSGGVFVVPSADRVSAYDALTGAPRWERTFGPSNPTRAQIGPDDVHAVELGDSVVLALTKWNELAGIAADTSAVLWTRPLDRSTDANAGILAHGSVGFLLGDPGAKVEAFDLATGKPLWTWRDSAAPGVIPRLSQARLVGRDAVAVILDGKRLALLDRGSGTTRWYASSGEAWFGDVHAIPDGSALLVRASGNGDPKFWVFDTKTGKELWRDDGYGAVLPGPRPEASQPMPFLEDVVPGETAIYSFRRRSGATEVWAQDLLVGTKLWKWEAPRGATGPTTIVETPTSLIVGRDGGLDRATVVVLGKGTGQPEQVALAAPGDPLELPGRRFMGRGLVAVANTVIATTERGTCGLANVDDDALARETIEAATKLAGDDSPQRRAALAHEFARAEPPRLEDAIAACSRALETESVSGEQYDRIFAQLAALAEAAVEQRTPSYEIRRMTRPPEIDGELNDWWRDWSAIDLSGPRYVQPIQLDGGRPGRWNGPEDLSAKLYMGWDEKYFYFALDVLDADLRPYDSESDRWLGDCLLIAIDCKNDGGFRFMRDDMLLSLALTLPKKKKDEKEQKGDEEDANKPEGKYFVKRKDDGSGAVYEAEIPWALFVKNGVTNGIDPVTNAAQAGFTFGFNIVLIDDDGDRYAREDLPPGAKGDGSDGNPKEGDFRGALKTLQLTPSVLLHERKDRLWQGYIPEYFAKITLK